MLVATLMGPILGIGLALVDADNRLLRRSLLALAGGALLVLATGALLGAVAPDVGPTGEMLSRTSPRALDLVVALASGAIGAYALASPRLVAAVVGVAIAVALVPPLATASMFAVRAEWDLARGAFLLAFVNMVGIQVGASATLWLCGYRDGARRDRPGLTATLRRELPSLTLIVALSVLLLWHGAQLVAKQRYETDAREALLHAIAGRAGARLDEVLFTVREGRPVVTAVVRSPRPLTLDEVAAIGRLLPRSPDGSAPRLLLRHVEVDIEAAG